MDVGEFFSIHIIKAFVQWSSNLILAVILPSESMKVELEGFFVLIGRFFLYLY